MYSFGRVVGKYPRKSSIICHVALNDGEIVDVTSCFLDLPLEHSLEDIITKTTRYCESLNATPVQD